MTFTISPEQFAQFVKKLAVLNRRAAKCKTEPLTIARQVETVVKIDGKFHPAVEFDLDGQVPRIGDFELLATLTHTEAGNIISKAPAARELDLEAYRSAGPGHCDHCNKNRARLETYILRGLDGALIRVGRNCLADFLRCPDVDNAVWRLSLLSELGEMADEFGTGGGSGSSYICIDEYLACAVASTRRHGFRKTDSENSTRKDVAYLVHGPGRNATSEDFRAWVAARPTESDRELAKAVREWGKVQGGTEFSENLSVVCRLDYVLPKSSGLLAAAPYCFDATMAPARAGYRPFSDAWLGVTGERLRKLQIKVIKAHCVNTSFGVSTFYTLQDLDSGCCLSWKASGEPLGTETGREFTLDGTVKTHDTFRETKQTILTRCSIHLAKESDPQ